MNNHDEPIDEVVEEPSAEDGDTTENENASQDDMLRNDVDQFWNIRSYFNRGTLLEMPQYSFHIIGVAYTGHFVYTYYETILYYSYILSLFMGSVYVGNALYTLIHNYIYKSRMDQIKEVDEEDEYHVFLEKDIDTLMDIYKDPLMKSQEYENTNIAFIKDLNKVHHHYESTLPFHHNNQLIMYYNHDDDSFHYFTKNSNIQYKVLNSVCRSYLLHIRCLNLFKDEIDLERICPCNDTEFEKIEENSVPEQKEECDNTVNSIFYVKKTRKEKEKEKRKQETKDKIIHKYIYKGNLEEYKNLYKENVSIKKVDTIDYAAYKKSQESNL